MWFHKNPIAQNIEQIRPYAEVFVRRYLSDPDAEDVIQEVLIAAMQGLPQLDKPEAWKGWLEIVAQRCVTDYLRKKERQQPRETGAAWDRLRSDFINSHNDLFHRRFPGQEAAWNEICRLLQTRSRLAFLQRAYFEDSTQNVMLSEVKDWLREYLDEREQTFSEIGNGGEGLELDGLVIESAVSEDPAEIVARRQVIDHCFSRLNEREREVVVLRAMEGWEYDEIAEALNITSANARKIYERAREKLRRCFQEHLSPD